MGYGATRGPRPRAGERELGQAERGWGEGRKAEKRGQGQRAANEVDSTCLPAYGMRIFVIRIFCLAPRYFLTRFVPRAIELRPAILRTTHILRARYGKSDWEGGGRGEGGGPNCRSCCGCRLEGGGGAGLPPFKPLLPPLCTRASQPYPEAVLLSMDAGPPLMLTVPLFMLALPPFTAVAVVAGLEWRARRLTMAGC
eukprot:839591-Rhodomonas_salina.1